MKHTVCLAAMLCLLSLGAAAQNLPETRPVQTAEACGTQLLDLVEKYPRHQLLLVDLADAHKRVIQAAAELDLQSFSSAVNLQIALEQMSERYADVKKKDASFAATVRDLLLFGYNSGYDQKRHTLAELVVQTEDVLAERHDIAIEIHRDLMMNNAQDK